MFVLVQSFDDSVLQWFVALRTDALTTVMMVVSTLGEWYVLLPATAIISFILWRRGLVLQAAGLAYAVVGTSIAVTLLKMVTARPRPPEALRLVAESGYSFPSWHAAAAIAFWGYLAYMATKRIQNPIVRICIALLCLLIILATDFSRLYLGVHYFSDVAFGTLLGGLILLFSL